MGPGLLVGAVFVRALSRAFSMFLFGAGVLVVGYLAFDQWVVSRDLFLVAVILGAGLALAWIVRWVVRALSLVVGLALFAAGWFLVLYGWMGPEFIATGLGVGTWAVATGLSVFVGERIRGWRATGVAVKLAAASG